MVKVKMMLWIANDAKFRFFVADSIKFRNFAAEKGSLRVIANVAKQSRRQTLDRFVPRDDAKRVKRQQLNN